MFFPKSLLELEALLPVPLPPSLRRFFARCPQANAVGGLYFYNRSWILERYRDLVGADAYWIPFARSGSTEFQVHVETGVVRSDDGHQYEIIAENFTAWLKTLRAEHHSANHKKLIRAARAGDLKRLHKLLKRGADINEQDAAGNTPLMAALLAWQYEAAILLVGNGADPAITDREGHTALMWACYRNHYVLVRMLLNAGASVSARTRSGEGIVYFALTGPRPGSEGGSKGSRDIVEMLLESGLDLSAPALPGDKAIFELDDTETDPDLWQWLKLQ